MEFLSPFLEEQLLLTCDGNDGNSFPTTQGKDPSSRARRRKRGSSGCGWDSRASPPVETGMSGNFLSCSKGGKDHLVVAEVRSDYPETPQQKGPHLAGRGEPSGFSRVAAGALDLLREPQGSALVASGSPVPMRVARGPLGIPLRSMLGPKILCGVGART